MSMGSRTPRDSIIGKKILFSAGNSTKIQPGHWLASYYYYIKIGGVALVYTSNLKPSIRLAPVTKSAPSHCTPRAPRAKHDKKSMWCMSTTINRELEVWCKFGGIPFPCPNGVNQAAAYIVGAMQQPQPLIFYTIQISRYMNTLWMQRGRRGAVTRPYELVSLFGESPFMGTSTS